MARGGTDQGTQHELRQWHEIAAHAREIAAIEHAQQLTDLLRAVRSGEHGRDLAKRLGISTMRINSLLSEHASKLPGLDASQRRQMSYAKAECAVHATSLWRREATGQWRCAACVAATHSAKHRARAQAARARGEGPARGQRQAARDLKVLLLDGRPCASCGYDTSPFALQFHHRDPTTKVADVSRFRNEALARAEADKCDVYCANCHEQLEVERAADHAPLARGSAGVTFDCAVHGQVSAGLAAGSKKSVSCAQCKAEYLHALRRRKKQLVVAGMGGACVCCGYDDVMTLQCHHLDPAIKQMSIARAIRSGAAWHLVQAEAAVCALVCPNCHVEVERGLRELPASLPPVAVAAL
jgi:hypothetical protein